MPSSALELHIGARVQYDGSRGTVRYLGPIVGRGETQWAGIEWDDSARGRHSGTHDGQVYFECRPGAGSFVKQERLGDGGRTMFLEAVKTRYTQDALDTTFRDSLLVVGGGLVTIEDCDEKRRREVALAGLRNVDVSGMGVASVREEKLSTTLPAVEELRVARSLFCCLEVVFDALDAFPKLRLLDASRNVLEGGLGGEDGENSSAEDGKRDHGLEEVVLNHCKLSWGTVTELCGRARRLRVLRLHDCGLTDMTSGRRLTTHLQCVQTLDLDGNKLKWEDITQHIGRLPKLTEVYLSNNNLHDTELPEDECFLQTRVLSLADNALQGWRVIGWLDRLPALRSLRICGNPVTPGDESQDGRLTWRMRVIGRVRHVQTVDGSRVSADERLLSEKRYASDEVGPAWRADGAAARRAHPRLDELRTQHGLGGAGRGGGGGGCMRDDLVRVRLVAGRDARSGRACATRRMPRGAQMARVRAVARRVLRVEGRVAVGVVVGERVEWPDDHERRLAFWCADADEVCVVAGGARDVGKWRASEVARGWGGGAGAGGPREHRSESG